MRHIDLVKLGGYAMMLKEAANLMINMKNQRGRIQRRQNLKNLLLGATIGTAAGATAGLLFAPHSGRETRERITQQTGETIANIKERVSQTSEAISAKVKDKAAHMRDAAEICSEAVRDTTEKDEKKSKQK